MDIPRTFTGRALVGICAGFCLCAAPAFSQFGDLSGIAIETVKIRDNAYLLKNPHGNVLILVGPDGVLMVDDQLAPLADKLLAAVSNVTDQQVRYIISTHFHMDHAGGNAKIHSRTGALIIAHENVRKRMATPQFVEFFNNRMPPYPPEALPGLTYENELHLHINGEVVDVLHVTPAGHTDGDSFVLFRGANILHGGDSLTFGQYPFMDQGSGGSARGYALALDRILPMLNEKTVVIPGHGPLGNRAQLQELRDMLVTTIGRVDELMRQGKSRAEITRAGLTAKYDQTYANPYIKPQDLIGFIYDDIAASTASR